MRLVQTTTLQLEEFFGDETPRYAILSHTWEKEEILFRDIQDLAGAANLAGFAKVSGAAAVARGKGLDYVWIDTCCIDKSSSAELSEAINSMFRWYKESTVCLAYLADVSWPGGPGFFQSDASTYASRAAPKVGLVLTKSKWFTRGWTLQELIAPAVVEFYSQEWKEFGTKGSTPAEVAEASGVDTFGLAGNELSHVSVARKMSWAADRRTTRLEDMAYCLMGLFNVSMPLLYGEGKKAFYRLQEEIIKSTTDDSIFAWDREVDYGFSSRGLLALSPQAFKETGRRIGLLNRRRFPASPVPSISGRGVQISLMLCKDAGTVRIAALDCQLNSGAWTFPGIELMATPDSRVWFRSPKYVVFTIDLKAKEAAVQDRFLGRARETPSMPRGAGSGTQLHVSPDWQLLDVFVPHKLPLSLGPLIELKTDDYANCRALGYVAIAGYPLNRWDATTGVLHGLGPGSRVTLMSVVPVGDSTLGRIVGSLLFSIPDEEKKLLVLIGKSLLDVMRPPPWMVMRVVSYTGDHSDFMEERLGSIRRYSDLHPSPDEPTEVGEKGRVIEWLKDRGLPVVHAWLEEVTESYVVLNVRLQGIPK